MAAAKIPKPPAARLADRLNYLPAAVFFSWLSPIVYLWLQLLAPALPPLAPALQPLGWALPASPAAPWFSLAIGVTAVFTVLPRAWYRTRRFEHPIYRWLGVRHFRKLATNGDTIVRFVRRRYPNYTVHRRDFAQALAATMVAEKVHLPFFIFGAATSLYLVRIGWFGLAAWSIITNIAGNLYPVLLQRYTRARLARLSIA